ncbi:MAG TPA: hypothetical protein VMD30_12930 [Tepidisphaeraceae bacterium]|nr:hypothetical protein [Tepidisphaeraceae bacterium]
MDLSDLASAVRRAADRADVSQAVHSLYSDLATEIARRRPVCQISGRCCRFEEYGHRLYVTTVELAAFLSDLRSPSVADGQPTPSACPFQTGKFCGVHSIRPMGCRLFFCDATATEWQRVQYERFHARLKVLHEELSVPYFYVEWRQALELVLPTR